MSVIADGNDLGVIDIILFHTFRVIIRDGILTIEVGFALPLDDPLRSVPSVDIVQVV